MKEILKESFTILKRNCIRNLKKYLPLVGSAALLVWVIIIATYEVPFLLVLFGTVWVIVFLKFIDIIYMCANHVHGESFPLPEKKYVREEDGILLVEKEDMQSLFLYMQGLEMFLDEKGYIFEKGIDKTEKT